MPAKLVRMFLKIKKYISLRFFLNFLYLHYFKKKTILVSFEPTKNSQKVTVNKSLSIQSFKSKHIEKLRFTE